MRRVGEIRNQFRAASLARNEGRSPLSSRFEGPLFLEKRVVTTGMIMGFGEYLRGLQLLDGKTPPSLVTYCLILAGGLGHAPGMISLVGISEPGRCTVGRSARRQNASIRRIHSPTFRNW
jgi:hypothetical protein